MRELRCHDFAILALDRCRYASSSRLQAFDTRPGRDGHALFGQRLFKEGRDISILYRHDAVEHFNHSDICPHIVVKACEFYTNRAGTNNKQFLWYLGRHHRVAIGPDALSVCRRKRQIAGACAGGDDDILRGQLLGLTVFGDRECVRRE